MSASVANRALRSLGLRSSVTRCVYQRSASIGPMRTLAALAFIAGVGGVASYLAQRPTIADGGVMAADLLAQLRARNITAVACDREIPIGPRGAVFQCTAT